jgi:hypothetical protein
VNDKRRKMEMLVEALRGETPLARTLVFVQKKSTADWVRCPAPHQPPLPAVTPTDTPTAEAASDLPVKGHTCPPPLSY